VNAPLVITLVVIFGTAVTLALSRLLRVRLTAPKLLLTVFGTTAISSAATVLAYFAFTSWDCPPDWLCDYPGMFGAGIALGSIWLACYCVVYVAVALLVARSQWRSRSAESALTPNNSLERTREG
jgi:hypothetical protein